MAMHLTSSAFSHGSAIPARFTADGAGRSPPLTWADAPSRTRSFAMICRDPDARSGAFYHWALYDIPAVMTGLEESCPSYDPEFRQARNDFGHIGYGGPNPPRGHGDHHYHFTLYALDVANLGVAPGPASRAVEAAAKLHALATADLIGTYER